MRDVLSKKYPNDVCKDKTHLKEIAMLYHRWDDWFLGRKKGASPGKRCITYPKIQGILTMQTFYAGYDCIPLLSPSQLNEGTPASDSRANQPTSPYLLGVGFHGETGLSGVFWHFKLCRFVEVCEKQDGGGAVKCAIWWWVGDNRERTRIDAICVITFHEFSLLCQLLFKGTKLLVIVCNFVHV